MIKIIDEFGIEMINHDSCRKAMRDMKPLEVCIIRDDGVRKYNGMVVMRTASLSNAEIMSLSSPGANKCWVEDLSLRVEPLKDPIFLKLTGAYQDQ